MFLSLATFRFILGEPTTAPNLKIDKYFGNANFPRSGLLTGFEFVPIYLTALCFSQRATALANCCMFFVVCITIGLHLHSSVLEGGGTKQSLIWGDQTIS